MSNDDSVYTLPYVHILPEGITDCLAVSMSVTVSGNFQIDFTMESTTDSRADCVFSFDAHLGDGYVVRSYRQNGQVVAAVHDGGMPFKKGDHDIDIVVTTQEFKVSVDGKHFCDYQHRLAKEMAQFIMIQGQLTLIEIGYNYTYADGYGPNAFGFPGEPVFNPATPYEVAIPGGLYPGRLIMFSGMPVGDAKKFSIRFGTKAKDDKIIGFRLQALLDSKTIALNSRINGSWGTEEKHTSVFPFEKDESFDINIVVKLDAIKVAVNGKSCCDFKHRLHPPSKMTSLCIEDDVKTWTICVL